MAKRKAAQANIDDIDEAPPLRRSSRRLQKSQPTAKSTQCSDEHGTLKDSSSKCDDNRPCQQAPATDATSTDIPNAMTTTIPSTIPPGDSRDRSPISDNSRSLQYWLLKAEPEPRMENGINVAFSIDDLASRKVPEPWDGIRNYVARNNLRAMRQGDQAFFYHSNCAAPGIVGIMEIVREASTDETAWDANSAYYDPKDGPDKRKWSLVHVEFRRKFAEATRSRLELKELKRLREQDAIGKKELADMQLLKQTRLSVTKVSEREWRFIMGIVEEMEGGT